MNASLRNKLCVAAMAALAGTVANRLHAGNWIGPTGTSGSPADWFDPANWAVTDSSGVPGDGLPTPATDDVLAQWTQAFVASQPGDYFINIGSTLNLTANGGAMKFPDLTGSGSNSFSGSTFTFTATGGAVYNVGQIREGPQNTTITFNAPVGPNNLLNPGSKTTFRFNGGFSGSNCSVIGPSVDSDGNPVTLATAGVIDLPAANPSLGSDDRFVFQQISGTVDIQIGNANATAGNFTAVAGAGQTYDATFSLRGVDFVSGSGRKFIAGVQRVRAIADPTPGADNTADRTLTWKSSSAAATFFGLALRGPDGVLMVGPNGAGQTGHFTLKLLTDTAQVAGPNGDQLDAVPTVLAPNTTVEFAVNAGLLAIDGAETRTGIGGSMIISGSGDVVKSGPGTLRVDTANTYTGRTTITGGTILINNAAALNTTSQANLNSATAALNVVAFPLTTPSTLSISGTGGTVYGSVNHNAGTIGPGTDGGQFTAGTVNFNDNLTLAGGAMYFDVSGTNTVLGNGTNDYVNVGAAATLAMNSGVVTLNFFTAPTPGNAYKLIGYTTKSGAVGNLTPNSRANVTLSDNGTQIIATVNSYSVGNLTWNGMGGGSGTWDVGVATNWLNPTPAADKFFQLDNVTFNDAAGVQTTVNVSTVVAPGSIVVNNSINSYTWAGNGTIAGSTTLLKQGSASLTINTNATYTGATTIEGGRLTLVGSKAWGPVLSGPGGGNIKGSTVVFDYNDGSADPASTIQTILTASYATNFAAGQIRSSTAVANQIGLGWRDDTTAKQVTVRRALYGDANLDGSVDTVDFNFLASSFSQSGRVWADGDFNYDGTVDTVDFNLLAANFGQSLAAPAGAGTLVPEPALGIALLGGAVAVLTGRRRRRKG